MIKKKKNQTKISQKNPNNKKREKHSKNTKRTLYFI